MRGMGCHSSPSLRPPHIHFHQLGPPAPWSGRNQVSKKSHSQPWAGVLFIMSLASLVTKRGSLSVGAKGRASMHPEKKASTAPHTAQSYSPHLGRKWAQFQILGPASPYNSPRSEIVSGLRVSTNNTLSLRIDLKRSSKSQRQGHAHSWSRANHCLHPPPPTPLSYGG